MGMTRPHTLSSRRRSGWMPLRTAGPCSNLTNTACLLEGRATDQGTLLGRAPGGHPGERGLASRAPANEIVVWPDERARMAGIWSTLATRRAAGRPPSPPRGRQLWTIPLKKMRKKERTARRKVLTRLQLTYASVISGSFAYGGQSNRLLYFRQDDWEVLCRPLLDRLASTTFRRIQQVIDFTLYRTLLLLTLP